MRDKGRANAKQGGHFAAMEKPEVLLKDVEDFVAQVWSTASKL